MRFVRKIASYFLLALFSLMQLHTVLPHIHHQHESEEHTDNDHFDAIAEHHHEGDTTDDHHTLEIDFLDYFFEGHTHQSASENPITTEHTFQLEITKSIKLVSKTAFSIHYDSLIDYSSKQNRPRTFVRHNSYDYYLYQSPHRGPPLLV